MVCSIRLFYYIYFVNGTRANHISFHTRLSVFCTVKCFIFEIQIVTVSTTLTTYKYLRNHDVTVLVGLLSPYLESEMWPELTVN